MRITILALGTRGDVQPYVALRLGLQRAGHEVRLVAFGQFQAFVESKGLDFFPAGADTHVLGETAEEARAIIATIIQGGTIRQQWQAYRKFRPIMDGIPAAGARSCAPGPGRHNPGRHDAGRHRL